MPRSPRVSVAIPVYNEQDVVPELVTRVSRVLDQIDGGPHELVIVDDGSSDRTLDELRRAASQDERLVVVSLSRNFGHQAALSAALDHAAGDVIVVMDGDLQDTPETIPAFLAKYHDGYEVVYAQRIARKEGMFLRISYFLFYRLLARLAKTRMPLDAGDFGLMSRRVVDEIRRAPERQRYLRGLRTWVGFRQTGLAVERSGRHAGKSKYTPLKLLGLALDGIFAFSVVPLRAAAVLGLFAVALSSAFAIYALYARLVLNRSPQGFTALLLVITFMSGVHLFFVGVIGEYVGRIYEEVKARPIYIVNQVITKQRPAAWVEQDSELGGAFQ